MLVLGLQGSPRRKSNTFILLDRFLQEARTKGCQTFMLEVCRKQILPCKELVICEKKGECPLLDDMHDQIYTLLRRADVVVMATPIFFYNVPAQLKALIDRTQTLWARKYRLALTDPKRSFRKGFVLAQGATRGKNLFEGLQLTTKYFFDAIGATPAGNLYYWKIEKPGDMAAHPTFSEDVRKAAADLLDPLVRRRRVLFVDRDGAGLAPMAWAFCQIHAGDRIDADFAGISPAGTLRPFLETAMTAKGIDMGFFRPQSIDELAPSFSPQQVVALGADVMETVASRFEKDPVEMTCWELPTFDTQDSEQISRLCKAIEEKVQESFGMA